MCLQEASWPHVIYVRRIGLMADSSTNKSDLASITPFPPLMHLGPKPPCFASAATLRTSPASILGPHFLPHKFFISTRFPGSAALLHAAQRFCV